MSKWGVHTIQDMIGSSNIHVMADDGSYWRAVPSPYRATFIERISLAWSVLRGKNYVVKWPVAGELEKAIRRE